MLILHIYKFNFRGEKRSSYDKKDQSKESGSNEKSSQKSSATTNDSKVYGGKYQMQFF